MAFRFSIFLWLWLCERATRPVSYPPDNVDARSDEGPWRRT